MSMLSQYFSVIIDCGISEPGHIIEVADGLNAIENVSLTINFNCETAGLKCYDTYIVMHTGTHTYDVTLAREF